MKPALRKALTALLGDAVEFDVPMARFTSLRVGGPVDAIATPPDRAHIAPLMALCDAHGVPVHPLGAGFNTVVRQSGLEGVAIRLKKLRAIERVAPERLRVEAGVSHSQLTRFCVDRGLSGLEFGAGIPGTLGGWIAMNAGIGTREVKDVLESLRFCDHEGGLHERTRRELDFEYRALRGLPVGSLVLEAELRVEPSSPENVRDEVERMLAHRSETQPIDVPSCGSVFKNPAGDYAGRLIEAAGLKGTRIGGAEISSVHANFIVNRGGASADDVLALIARARAEVARDSGIELETEVRIWGREDSAPEGGQP